MSKKKQLDLSTFDDQLLDGLDFCRNVYDLFDQIRNGPEGIARIRLRQAKMEKRLVEELIPIARYVQARYRKGRRIKVRWFGGSQLYDAILWSSGLLSNITRFRSVFSSRSQRQFTKTTTSGVGCYKNGAVRSE